MAEVNTRITDHRSAIQRALIENLREFAMGKTDEFFGNLKKEITERAVSFVSAVTLEFEQRIDTPDLNLVIVFPEEKIKEALGSI